MYDELVKRLRAQAVYMPEKFSKNAELLDVLMKAADAIEFLQTYKVAFENIVSIGGWWLVGQDKNLYRMDVPMNWPPKGTKTVELFPPPKPPKESEKDG